MENRFGGHLNLVNPEPISLYEIVKLYQEVVDPSVNPIGIAADSERGKQLLATKGNCALTTDVLQKVVPIPSSTESLRTNFQKMTIQ